MCILQLSRCTGVSFILKRWRFGASAHGVSRRSTDVISELNELRSTALRRRDDGMRRWSLYNPLHITSWGKRTLLKAIKENYDDRTAETWILRGFFRIILKHISSYLHINSSAVLLLELSCDIHSVCFNSIRCDSVYCTVHQCCKIRKKEKME